MFKKIIFTATFICLTALSASASGLGIFQSSNMTPNEILENNYNSSSTMSLSQLPTKQTAQNWSCVGTTPNTTVNSLGKLLTPILVTVQNVTTPAIPSNGPLFPSKPTQIETLSEIAFTGGMNIFSTAQYIKDIKESEVHIDINPELSQSSFGVKENGDVDTTWRFSTTFKMKDNMIFIKSDASKSGMVGTILLNYYYCYKK